MSPAERRDSFAHQAGCRSDTASAKFAVHGFTEALRVELAAEHAPVSVTLVHPGRIDTPYNEHVPSYVERQPSHDGMVYPPEAVAEAILYAAAHRKRAPRWWWRAGPRAAERGRSALMRTSAFLAVGHGVIVIGNPDAICLPATPAAMTERTRSPGIRGDASFRRAGTG